MTERKFSIVDSENFWQPREEKKNELSLLLNRSLFGVDMIDGLLLGCGLKGPQTCPQCEVAKSKLLSSEMAKSEVRKQIQITMPYWPLWNIICSTHKYFGPYVRNSWRFQGLYPSQWSPRYTDATVASTPSLCGYAMNIESETTQLPNAVSMPIL